MAAAATTLRAECLGFREVVAQSVAMLGPTLTPVLIVPLMAGSAGNGSWLAYALGTLLLLAVALSIRAFAVRSASAGSLFEYSRRAFGTRGGLLCGWALLWAYVLVGVAGVTGFAVFATTLFHFLHAPEFLLRIVASLACITVALAFAYRDIRLSTETLLALEIGSVLLVSVLLVVVLIHGGTIVDPDQLALRGATPSGLALGVVVAIFSLVGFESATSLGAEARDPLRTIPAAVIASVLIAGVFFVVCAYAELLGARALGTTVDKLATPLDALAGHAGVVPLGLAIDIGALLSSFSITLASLNAGARILYTLGKSGLFASGLARTHPEFQTPNVAILTFGGLIALVTEGMLVGGISPLDAFNDTATLGSFGFVAIYLFVAAGAPIYLRRRGELKSYHVVLGGLTLTLLLVPAIGSVYPAPPPPANVFPYLFVAYVLVGFLVLWLRGSRTVSSDFEESVA
jgi:amino acid transporter